MESHLLQMRGLKPNALAQGEGYLESHLLQMRGLKPRPGGIAKKLLVASFTDAWIETVNEAGHTVTTVSHLLQMRGLKHIPSQNDDC